MTTTTHSIPLNRLVPSAANVRRTDPSSGIEALMASIAAHGLRQNLNVRPTSGGRYEVIAGGRRLIALRKLAKAGTIDARMAVPCLVLTEAENATEISLAENQLREAMHPDDQCEAFRSLIDAGMPVEDVAARFGVTPAVVRQRLKLAAVSPTLRVLYRDGKATLAQMMALTLSDDHAAQEAAYAACGDAGSIRRSLTQDSVRIDSRRVRFVGLEAYRDAGGTVLDDLFNPADSYLTDPALLDQLVAAKLAEVAEGVKAEGWSWVLAQPYRDYETPYSRVHGTLNDAFKRVFTPEEQAVAGARVTLDYDGTVVIDRGLVRAKDARRLAGATGADDAGRAARADYSAAVVTDLTAHRTAALRLELAQQPAVALAAVVHALVLAQRGHAGSCLPLSVKFRDLTRLVTDPEDCAALAGSAAELNRWNDHLPARADDLWQWCLAQDQSTLLDVLAGYAALAVDDVSPWGLSQPGRQLTDALSLDMTRHWQPTAAFTARLSKPVLAKALAEAGQPTIAANIMVMKKAAAAVTAAAHWLPPVFQPMGDAPANDNVPRAMREIG